MRDDRLREEFAKRPDLEGNHSGKAIIALMESVVAAHGNLPCGRCGHDPRKPELLSGSFREEQLPKC